jgi:hypothetical protein
VKPLDVFCAREIPFVRAAVVINFTKFGRFPISKNTLANTHFHCFVVASRTTAKEKRQRKRDGRSRKKKKRRRKNSTIRVSTKQL